MRKSIQAALTSVAACASVGAMLVTGPGTAAAGPQHDPIPEKERAAVVKTVDKALARDLKIDVKEYVKRGETAKKLDEFWQKESKDSPESILSVRMDGSRGIVNANEKGKGFKELSASAEKAGFEITTASTSKSKIDEQTGTMQHRLDSLPKNLKDRLVGPALPDYQNARVNVSVFGEKEGKEITGFLGNDIPRNLTIIREAAKPKALPVGNQESAAPGAAYLAVSGADKSYASGCSVAFPVTDANGSNLALTAGHCGVGGKKGTSVYQGGERFGDFVSQAFGGYQAKGNGYDYALIKLKRDFTDNDFSSPAVKGSVNPVTGASICKYGARTGVTCGTITDVNSVSAVPRAEDDKGTGTLYVRGFAIDTCAKPGDSGGALITGEYATGIVSTGNASSENCVPGKNSKDVIMTATPVEDIFEASRNAEFANENGKDLKLKVKS